MFVLYWFLLNCCVVVKIEQIPGIVVRIVLSQVQQQLVSTCNTIGFHLHQVWAISFAGFAVIVQR